MLAGFLKKKLDYLLLLSTTIFFVTINLIYFYLNYNESFVTQNYALNELFINYQSGFIRRGLLGEIAWQLNILFEIDPKLFFSLFFLTIYLAQFYFLLRLFKRFVSFKLIFIFIFLSPSLLLFHIYSPELYFLKDGLIKLAILIHAFIFYHFVNCKKDYDKYIIYLKFLIIPILFLIILTHEYQFFSISIHFLVSLGIYNKNYDLQKIIKIYSPLIIPFFLVIFFFGDMQQFENLSLILKKFSVELNPHLGGGFLKYLGAFYKWHFFYFSYRDFLNLFVSVLLSFVVIYLLFQYLIKSRILFYHSRFQKNYLIYFIPCLLPFFLTTDHGRNLSLLSFYLISFYATLNLKNLSLANLNKKIQLSLLNKLSLIIFLFFFIFMWKLNQFAGFGLQGKPNDIFQSSLFAEFIKLTKFLYNYIDLNIVNLPEIRL